MSAPGKLVRSSRWKSGASKGQRPRGGWQWMRDGETVASIQMRAEQDASRFLDQWGSLAAELQWTPGDLFDVPRDGKPAVPAKNAQTEFSCGLAWFVCDNEL